jgi:cobalamin biosynthesis protein CobW
MLKTKIPVTIITGFLGAGKTSLIRHILENANGKRLALIINEFGDVGVDADIVKGCGIENCPEENVVELANGCLCCTVADEFLPTLQTLLSTDVPPDHIVIETSGLALPKPLVQAFQWPEVRSRTTVDGVVTVIDGPAVRDGMFAANPDAVDAQRAEDENLDHETALETLFADQLSCADLVLISKTDLLDAAALQSVVAKSRDYIRDGVEMLPMQHGKAPVAVVLGQGAAAEDAALPESHHHHHDDHDDHHHDHDHDDFKSYVLELPKVTDTAAFEQAVHAALKVKGVLRVKGFAAVEGKKARWVLQAVGARLQTYFDRPLQADDPQNTRLVVIGLRDFDMDQVSNLLTMR